MQDLTKLIREIPDYPKPGILFYDLTTLLQDKQGFHQLVDQLCEHYAGKHVDIVAGIEARGFIFAPALAYRLGAGFVPVRKPKKLALEDRFRHIPARIRQRHARNSSGRRASQGQRVLLCDDLLATGGTAAAAMKLFASWAAKLSALRSPSS